MLESINDVVAASALHTNNAKPHHTLIDNEDLKSILSLGAKGDLNAIADEQESKELKKTNNEVDLLA